MRSSKCGVLLAWTLFLSIAGSGAARREVLQDGECDVADVRSCSGNAVCAATLGNDAGTCARIPTGGAVLTSDPDFLPTPLAYFPLSGREVVSWPTGEYEGTANGAVLVEDAEFGAAYHCRRDSRDSISLDAVPFGADGFTVNLWMRQRMDCKRRSEEAEYIFSTAHTDLLEDDFDPDRPNQAHLTLLPRDEPSNQGHLSAMLRGRIRERFDVETGPGAQIDLYDGAWHMLTFSTLPPVGRRMQNGYRTYVDGELAMEAVAADRFRRRLDLGDEIRLCGRVDRGGDFFDGLLTQLSIFGSALSPEQIEQLYRAVVEGALSEEAAVPVRYENEEETVVYVRAVETDSGVEDRTNAERFRRDDRGAVFDYDRSFRRARSCRRPGDCREDQTCTTVHPCALDFSGRSNPTSICSSVSNAGSVWNVSSAPVPLAYFPLTQNKIRSWPMLDFRGYRVNAKVVRDRAFGKALSCKKEDRSTVVIDNVPYGVGGEFGINFWFKVGDLSGRFFQYLFSHGPVHPSRNPWSHNQIQVTLPELEHTAGGVLRALVKDTDESEDPTRGAIFLDSDGEVGRTFSKNTSSTGDQTISPGDGAWHMLTLTSQGRQRRGFVMYLDGERVGQIDPKTEYIGDNDAELSIPAGGALRMGGKIYLCGRNDGSSVRYFDGRLAELTLFDRTLDETDAQDLYATALAAHPRLRS